MSLADRCDEIVRLIDDVLDTATGAATAAESEDDAPVRSRDGRWRQRPLPRPRVDQPDVAAA